MRRVNARDFAAQFEEFVDLARHEPIAVLRDGKPVGVFLSPQEYEHLQRLEDAHWAAKAQAATGRHDFLSPEETMHGVNERLPGRKT